MRWILATIWIGVACSAGQERPPAPGTVQATWLERLHLANAYILSTNYEAATPVLRALIQEADRPGPERERLPLLWNQLALADFGMGRYLDSERCFERALAAVRDASADAAMVFQVLNGMMLLDLQTMRFDQAERVSARISGLLSRESAVNPADLAQYHANLAALDVARRRYREAEELLVPAIGQAERFLGPDDPAVLRLLEEYGADKLVQGKWKEAIPCFERTLQTARRTNGPEHPGTARQLDNLAIAYRLAGRVAEAESLARQAASIFERKLGPDHPYVADALQEQAASLRKMKRGGEARALERRARLIRTKGARDNLLGGTVEVGELTLRKKGD